MEEKIRVHVVVSGRVQGVLYRRGAEKRAQELGVTGWTHNLIDGKVEIMAEGEKESIEQFVEWCRQGTTLAKVDKCDIEYQDYKDEFPDFAVREFGF